MSTTSRIPAATDALVTAAAAAVGATTTVVDGPPLSWGPLQVAQPAVSETSYLFIGAHPDDDTSITGEQDFNAAGAVSRDEQVTIFCTIYVFSGDQVMKVTRDAGFAVLGQVEQFIRSDPSLGGAVLYSRMGAVQSVDQRQTEDGTDVTVVFTIAARAYLN